MDPNWVCSLSRDIWWHPLGWQVTLNTSPKNYKWKTYDDDWNTWTCINHILSSYNVYMTCAAYIYWHIKPYTGAGFLLQPFLSLNSPPIQRRCLKKTPMRHRWWDRFPKNTPWTLLPNLPFFTETLDLLVWCLEKVHPWKLTWIPKMMVCKRWLLLNMAIFVTVSILNFWGGKKYYPKC